MRPLTTAHLSKTGSSRSRSFSTLCPRPLRPTLYDLDASPQTSDADAGGLLRRSHTSMFSQPRLASAIAHARPVGPPPTTTEFVGRLPCVLESASAARDATFETRCLRTRRRLINRAPRDVSASRERGIRTLAPRVAPEDARMSPVLDDVVDVNASRAR